MFDDTIDEACVLVPVSLRIPDRELRALLDECAGPIQHLATGRVDERFHYGQPYVPLRRGSNLVDIPETETADSTRSSGAPRC